MKKNLWKLLLVVFSMNLFVACGDDDDPTPTPNPTPDGIEWKDVTGEHSGSSIAINGAKVTDSYRAIKLSENTLGNAIIVLKNVVPENPEITFGDVEMKKSGDNYTFTAQTTDEATGTVISITNGTLTPSVLTKATESSSVGIAVTVTRKLTADVVGDWTLKFPNPVYTNIAGVGTGGIDQMVNQLLAGTIGQLITNKVSEVNISLGEDGAFGVSWINKESGKETTIPEPIAAMIDLTYFAQDGVYYMALAKSNMDLLATVLPAVIPEGMDELLLGLLQEKGGYYLLPLNYTVADGDATFYLSKDVLIPLLQNPAIGQLLQGMIPAGMEEQFAQILQGLPYANPLDFGLIFTK